MTDKITTQAASAAVREFDAAIAQLTSSLPASIGNDAELREAEGKTKLVVAMKKDITSRRLDLTRPLDDVKKAVMDLFRAPLERLENAEAGLKSVIKSYLAELERARIEAERKAAEERKRAEAEAEALRKKAEEMEGKGTKTGAGVAQILRRQAGQVEEAPLPAMAVAAPRVDQRMFGKKYYAEIVDFARLPDAFKLPDMARLNKLARDNKGQNPPPGAVFRSE